MSASAYTPRFLSLATVADMPTVIGTAIDGPSDAAMRAATAILTVWGLGWDRLSDATRDGIVLAHAARGQISNASVWGALSHIQNAALDVTID